MVKNIIISGGGTGGHFYPALAIGNELMSRGNFCVHYVGSTFGIEAEKLAALNVDYTLLPIRGLQRSFSWRSLGRNLLLPGRLLASKIMTKKLFEKINPVAVIGTGGYASALPLHIAVKKEIPVFIQEQNSYPGITTRYFAAYAQTVFTAFSEVEKYVKKKIVCRLVTRSAKTSQQGNA